MRRLSVCLSACLPDADASHCVVARRVAVGVGVWNVLTARDRVKFVLCDRCRACSRSRHLMLRALGLLVPFVTADVCPDSIDRAAASFARDGFAVLPNFASATEVAAMQAAMEEMVEAWWLEEQAAPSSAVFTTGANQSNAQAKSRYFFESADRVHFFREAEEEEEAAAGRPPLNKVGHGLQDGHTPQVCCGQRPYGSPS